MIGNAIFFAVKQINIHFICCSDSSESKTGTFLASRLKGKKSYDTLRKVFECMKNMSEGFRTTISIKK